jgi:hypothetical protein
MKREINSVTILGLGWFGGSKTITKVCPGTPTATLGWYEPLDMHEAENGDVFVENTRFNKDQVVSVTYL